MSLPEIVVVLAIIGIAGAILMPRLIGSQDGVNDQSAINTLDSAWESGEEYYQGKRGAGNPTGVPDEYTGFTPLAAWKIDPKLKWLGSPANPLTASSADQDKVYIAVAGDAGESDNGNSGQVLGLCSASKTLVICKYDDGFAGGDVNSGARKLGPRYGASRTNQQQALCRAERVNSSATLSAGAARGEALGSSASCAG